MNYARAEMIRRWEEWGDFIGQHGFSMTESRGDEKVARSPGTHSNPTLSAIIEMERLGLKDCPVVDRVYRGLRPETRAVMYGVYVKKMPLHEIGAQFNWSSVVMRRRQDRAYDALKLHLIGIEIVRRRERAELLIDRQLLGQTVSQVR